MKPFLPAIICAVVIFGLSVGPGIQLPETLISSPDKLGHLVAYGILGWLSLSALSKNKTHPKSAVFLALLAVTIYGVVLEFVQWAFFPNRFFEVWDMVANFLGVLLSYFAHRFFKQPLL